MTFKEYAKKYLNPADNVTMIRVHSVKDENTPFYHSEYAETPIHSVSEWMGLKASNGIYVLNDEQSPIDWLCGANWGNAYRKGWLKCLLVADMKALTMQYSKEQAKDMIDFCEKEIIKKHRPSRK